MRLLKLVPQAIIWAVMAMAVLAGCAGKSATDGQVPYRLRVMAYNIHHCRGMDGVLDVERIANVIKASNADLVTLQEVDVNTQRNGGVDQAAELGRLTGMHARFGKAIDYQGGEYGQAILSRWPIAEFDVHMLPSEEGREQRIAVAAGIRGDGRRPDILFVGTHLDHQGEVYRLPQAVRLLEILRDSTWETMLLSGDMNALPTSETMGLVLQEWEDTTDDDALTLPAPVPNRKIDYILFPKGHPWRVIHSEVVNEPVASDHRPVFAELEWTGK